MLTASRSLRLNSQSAPPLPLIPELRELYDGFFKFTPRLGDLMMIVGRSGAQKSGFAMWLAYKWGLPALYMSGDMSDFEASVRYATMTTGYLTDDVVRHMAEEGDEAKHILRKLEEVPVTFAFDSPISWPGINENLNAFTEVHNAWPKLIVVDNLMDMEGGESENSNQIALMKDLDSLKRDIGATILVLAHATDKSMDARNRPYEPPPINDIKNDLTTKPQAVLMVSLNNVNNQFNVCVGKQRRGPQDRTGTRYIQLRAFPEQTTFAPY